MVTEGVQSVKYFEGLRTKQNPSQSNSNLSQCLSCGIGKQTNKQAKTQKKTTPKSRTPPSHINHSRIFLKRVLGSESPRPHNQAKRSMITAKVT